MTDLCTISLYRVGERLLFMAAFQAIDFISSTNCYFHGHPAHNRHSSNYMKWTFQSREEDSRSACSTRRYLSKRQIRYSVLPPRATNARLSTISIAMNHVYCQRRDRFGLVNHRPVHLRRCHRYTSSTKSNSPVNSSLPSPSLHSFVL